YSVSECELRSFHTRHFMASAYEIIRDAIYHIEFWTTQAHDGVLHPANARSNILTAVQSINVLPKLDRNLNPNELSHLRDILTDLGLVDTNAGWVIPSSDMNFPFLFDRFDAENPNFTGTIPRRVDIQSPATGSAIRLPQHYYYTRPLARAKDGSIKFLDQIIPRPPDVDRRTAIHALRRTLNRNVSTDPTIMAGIRSADTHLLGDIGYRLTENELVTLATHPHTQW